MEYVEVNKIIFRGKQNIAWNDVEKYLRKYDGLVIYNKEYGDYIIINALFADEYTSSNYTKRLRGGLAKTKANIVQVIPELLSSASNRRWVENKDKKHSKNAIRGWYRYDVYFVVQVYDNVENANRKNYYNATAVARINDKGIFLHDIINIKKEARKPTDYL